MDGKSSQKTAKLDPDVLQKITDWIDTPEAKEKGFNSVARFLTIAASELLEKHQKKRFEHFNFADNLIRLIDNEKPQGTPFVEIVLKSTNLLCRICESQNCIHIQESWNHPEIKKALKRKNVKKLV